MRAKVAKNDILPAIVRAVSVADKKSLVPILSHILLDFNSSGLIVKAANVEHSIVDLVPADVDTFGAVAVPAVVLYDIVRKAADQSIFEFSLADKGSQLLVVAGKSKFELSTMDHADFPEISPIRNSCNFTMPIADFNRVISRTKFSMSPEENRHNLNGIYLQKEDNKLKAVSTDGHRLSSSEMEINTKENIQGVIISKKTVTEVKKMLDASQGDMTITFSANQVQFEIGNTMFISKLVDGTFPDYKRVIPEMSNDYFTVKRSDFIEIIDRIAVISDDKVRTIKLELNNKSLVCYVANSKVGSGREEVEVEYSGAGWNAGFNAGYLLDVAQAVSGERLRLYIKESLTPVLIVDESEAETFFVVMPMRI